MFLVFAGNYYYPYGGWRDFTGSFETLEAAKNYTQSIGADWVQIVCSESMKIVSEGELVRVSAGVYKYKEDKQ